MLIAILIAAVLMAIAMGAASSNRFDLAGILLKTNPVKVKGSTHIYQGTMVMVISGTGYLLPAADTSGGIFMGLAATEANNTGNDGDISCEVEPAGHNTSRFIEVSATSPDQTWVGKVCSAVDDISVALAGTNTNDVQVGRCIRVSKTGTSGKVILDTADRFAPLAAA